jgi:hypothetical protein
MSNINLHTCEKAAPGWQNKCKPCAECESEIRRRKMADDFCRSETVADFEKRANLKPSNAPLQASGADDARKTK